MLTADEIKELESEYSFLAEMVSQERRNAADLYGAGRGRWAEIHDGSADSYEDEQRGFRTALRVLGYEIKEKDGAFEIVRWEGKKK